MKIYDFFFLFMLFICEFLFLDWNRGKFCLDDF